MSKVEVSPGGVGFIRTPLTNIPGVPESAQRQQWAAGTESPQVEEDAERPDLMEMLKKSLQVGKA